MNQRMYVVSLICVLACMAISCQSVYYGAMEKVGVHKRDIMVKRVKGARNAQADAKEQFKTSLERFTDVLDFEGGDLQSKYDNHNKEFVRSEEKAQAVRDRIDAVESVSKALFKEWRSELKLYTNPDLRRASEKQYKATIDRYEELIETMRRAAAKMDPVLAVFRDQVLFLKHNLNSKAIASIQNEARQIQQRIDDLIRDMEKSIAEADSFISSLEP